MVHAAASSSKTLICNLNAIKYKCPKNYGTKYAKEVSHWLCHKQPFFFSSMRTREKMLIKYLYIFIYLSEQLQKTKRCVHNALRCLQNDPLAAAEYYTCGWKVISPCTPSSHFKNVRIQSRCTLLYCHICKSCDEHHYSLLVNPSCTDLTPALNPFCSSTQVTEVTVVTTPSFI